MYKNVYYQIFVIGSSKQKIKQMFFQIFFHLCPEALAHWDINLFLWYDHDNKYKENTDKQLNPLIRSDVYIF